MVSISAIDDHELILLGLESLFDEIGIEDFKTYESYEQMVEDSLHKQPDLFICDLYFPGRAFFPPLKELKSQFPNVKIIVLSAYLNALNLAQCTEINVQGMMSKEDHPDEVKYGILAVLRGETYVSPNLQGRLTQLEVSPFSNLTVRELQLLKLLTEGKRSKTISDILSISESTVEAHKTSIFKKLGVSTQLEAVLVAIKSGVISV